MAIISNGNTIIDAGAIDANEVNTTQIVNSAVNNDKIAASTIALAKLSASGSPSASTFLRGDNTWASPGGGTNTPAFYAYRSGSNQSVTSNTFTKVQFNSEFVDTNSAYDSSTNYRFTVPAGEGGKYMFFSTLTLTTEPSFYDISNLQIALYKNGSKIANVINANNKGDGGQYYHNSTTFLVSANAGDYFEIFCFAFALGPLISNYDVGTTSFGGIKIIE